MFDPLFLQLKYTLVIKDCFLKTQIIFENSNLKGRQGGTFKKVVMWPEKYQLINSSLLSFLRTLLNFLAGLTKLLHLSISLIKFYNKSSYFNWRTSDLDWFKFQNVYWSKEIYIYLFLFLNSQNSKNDKNLKLNILSQ